MKNKLIVGLLFLILILTACGGTIHDPKPDGDTTVSQGRIYEDTTDSSQSVSIYQLEFTDETQEGDNVIMGIDNPGFKFECFGFDKTQKLYVFMDGDIDNILGEFDISNEDKVYYENMININENKADIGSHTIQFVQFNGPDVIFCKTKHIEIVE